MKPVGPMENKVRKVLARMERPEVRRLVDPNHLEGSIGVRAAGAFHFEAAPPPAPLSFAVWRSQAACALGGSVSQSVAEVDRRV